MRCPRAVLRGDDGQVMLLSIAFGVLALLLVGGVVSAASIHLERKALLALADLAALDAADALDSEVYFDPGSTRSEDRLLPVTDAAVRKSVEDYLVTAPASADLPELVLVDARTIDARTVEVTLGSVALPPIVSWVTAPWSDGIPLQVTSRAHAQTS